MKHIKTYENPNAYHFYKIFKNVDELNIINDYLEELKKDNIKYEVFRINKYIKIYFNSREYRTYLKYSKIFDYVVSDKYDLTIHIPIDEKDIPIILNANKYNL